MEEVIYEGGNIPPLEKIIYIENIGYYVSAYTKNADGSLTATLREWKPF